MGFSKSLASKRLMPGYFFVNPKEKLRIIVNESNISLTPHSLCRKREEVSPPFGKGRRGGILEMHFYFLTLCFVLSNF